MENSERSHKGHKNGGVYSTVGELTRLAAERGGPTIFDIRPLGKNLVEIVYGPPDNREVIQIKKATKVSDAATKFGLKLG
ncbi:MAG: hypothetical protein PHW76_08020 [Alphaproteobacteria bacterium]|nr:hypothetical protein [Alphaproteobacteria bacterium]